MPGTPSPAPHRHPPAGGSDAAGGRRPPRAQPPGARPAVRAGRWAGAALAGALSALVASPAWAAGPEPGVPAAAGIFVGHLALAATAVAAGIVVLRPLADRPGPATRLWFRSAVLTAATADLLVVGLGGSAVPVAATLALALATLALPLLAARPAPATVLALVVPVGAAVQASTGRTAVDLVAAGVHGSAAAVLAGALVILVAAEPADRRVVARRSAPWVLAAVAALAATGLARATHARGGPGPAAPGWADPVFWASLGALAACAVGALVAVRGPGPDRRLVRGQSAVLLLAVLAAAGATVAALPEPVARPGVPLLVDLGTGRARLPVLVVPHRPGWNLVRVGVEGATVGLRPDRLTRTGARPAAGTGWALVELPEGRSRLYVSYAGRTESVRLDTGRSGAEPADLRGPDGPECVSAVLGTLAAGARPTPVRCPAGTLTTVDRQALDATVDFVAGRGATAIALLGDASPRGRAAVAAVTAAAERARLRIVAPGSGHHPLVVVTGWAQAEVTVRRVAAGQLPAVGTYLAPWLLTAPLLSPPAGQLVPLRFDPRDPSASRYVAALAARFPGDPPTAVGYRGWRGGGDPSAPARLYAASPVVLPGANRHGGHGDTAAWLPGGTITAVSGPLDRS